MNKVHKLAAYLLIGTLTLAGQRTYVFATQEPDVDAKKTVVQEATTNSNVATTEESTTNDNTVTNTNDNTDTGTNDNTVTTEESVAGINLSLDELFESEDNADKEISDYLTSETKSIDDNLAFAKVSDYVNIRSKASENSKILGKLYNNSSAKILSKKGGWYKITSGSVDGYIKGEFLVTGEKAAALAKKVGSRVATVTTTTLKVRDKASLKSEVLTLIPEGDEFKVVKKTDDWIKLSLGNKKYGYVATEYVKVNMEYEEAVSIKEEQERQAEEDATKSNSSTSSNSNASASRNTSTSRTSSTRSSSQQRSTPSSRPASTGSGLGSRIASYAVQFQGNPYVWGGTSLTNGTDCSGFTQSVFAHFGISIPRTSRTQAASGTRVSISNLKPGDLIFYTNGGSINHVALYIGGGKVISASSPSTGIRITSYNYRAPYKAVSYIN